MDMLRSELDPNRGIVGRMLFDLISAAEDPEVVDEAAYWSFVQRRLRLMSLGQRSSVTEHPVLGKVFKRLIEGNLTHRDYQRLLQNIDAPYVSISFVWRPCRGSRKYYVWGEKWPLVASWSDSAFLLFAFAFVLVP